MLLDHFFKMAAIFLVTPWMAGGLGKEQYGLWLLAMSLVGYLALIDFGITLAGSRYLARYLGAGNENRLQGTISALRKIYRKLGLACLLGVLLLTAGCLWFFRAEAWKEDLISIVVTLGLGTSVRIWCRLPAALLRGHLAYTSLVWASIARTLVQAVGAWSVLHAGAGFLALTLMYLAGDLLELALQRFSARRYYPSQRGLTPDEHKDESAEIFRYALQSLSGALATTLRGQVPPLGIAWALGVGTIPIYSIAMRLVGVVEDSLGALFGGQWLSAFSRMEGGENALLERRKWIQRLLRYAASLASAAIVGLLILGRPFLELWLGPAFVESHQLLHILAVPTVIYLAQWPARALIASSAELGAFTRWCFVGAAVVAAGSFVLPFWWGIAGVMWLIAIHHILIFGVLLSYYVGRIVQISPLTYWLPAVRIGLVMAFCAWGYSQLASPLLVPNYWKLFQAGVGLGVVCLVVIGVVGLNREERHGIWGIVKKRLGRR
ncbi:lipopolysaccharide biosynthesis protein [Prosthecobacter debontii]|nr:lipopolysaccharide biosynthesis protein [Prosthecobacter debontii]